MRENKFLRCYAEREGNLWVACCIDLSLAAQGDSMKEAKQKLHSQIKDYLEQAVNEDREHAYELLNRKADWTEFLRYYWIKFLCAIRDRNQGSTPNSLTFNENPTGHKFA